MKTFIYGLATGLYLAIALLLLSMLATALLMGCSHAPTPEQSWDQGHLKLNDHGCPTAIFIAPGGDLEECP
jgi:hypothetical protein